MLPKHARGHAGRAGALWPEELCVERVQTAILIPHGLKDEFCFALGYATPVIDALVLVDDIDVQLVALHH